MRWARSTSRPKAAPHSTPSTGRSPGRSEGRISTSARWPLCRRIGSLKYPAYLFHASARDLARFGLLYLHHGRWGDRQLIPESWIAESTKPYSTTNAGLGYGYLWWRLRQDNSALPPDSYFAWGHGGQFLFVIPSRDMVVVHLARERTGQDELGYRRVSGLLGLILAAAPEEPAVTPR